MLPDNGEEDDPDRCEDNCQNENHREPQAAQLAKPMKAEASNRTIDCSGKGDYRCSYSAACLAGEE
jgi:hypothetical protein